jgi:hypothetical protein
LHLPAPNKQPGSNRCATLLYSYTLALLARQAAKPQGPKGWFLKKLSALAPLNETNPFLDEQKIVHAAQKHVHQIMSFF